MDFGRIWTLRGGNYWADIPVLEIELHFTDAEPQRDLADQLLALTQAWQHRLGENTSMGLVHRTADPRFARLVFSFDEEALGKACLLAARDEIQASQSQDAFDREAKFAELQHLAHNSRLGPSTRSIVEAAQRRGIPCRRLNDGSLVQLGWGKKQKRIWTAETDDTPAIAETIAQDKQLTRNLLRGLGVPAPWGRPVVSADDAWEAAQETGLPVVVKPQFGNQGRGVATNLHTREQVLQAYEASRQISPHIVVESFLPGADHRLLVIGGRLVAAALREPAHVVGDGQANISHLIERANQDPRRSDGHATALSCIKIDAIGLAVLQEQGMTPASIPPPGQKVWIRRNANLSTGGTATDVTDRVHPEVAARAIDAALAVGLDVAGVDVVAEDISKPLESQGGGMVEVNAGPGLRMHLEPAAGPSRDVGAAIVDSLFPNTETGRIPIVAITGVNGKTTTARLLNHILRTAGWSVALTCTDGIYLNGRRTETRDCSGPQSAHTVLLNPNIEAAVLETARGGILREGLGFDQCDVGIVTNIGKGDHLGLRGIDTLDELARVKAVVVRAVASTGFAILNAADPLTAALAEHCRGQVVLFSAQPNDPELARHTGRAGTVSDGALMLRDGATVIPLVEAEKLPFWHGADFQIANGLAAACAAWCLGVEPATIASGLTTFTGAAHEAPGRFNVFDAGDGCQVIVDYAHNPSAVAALVSALPAFPQARRTLVFSGCNRRDEDLLEMGQCLGDAFDRVFLYHDWGHSGRADGELNSVLKQGFQRGRRLHQIVEVADEQTAITSALSQRQAKELVVVGVEAIEDSVALVTRELTRSDQV